MKIKELVGWAVDHPFIAEKDLYNLFYLEVVQSPNFKLLSFTFQDLQDLKRAMDNSARSFKDVLNLVSGEVTQ